MKLINYLPKVMGTYRQDAELAKLNWFKVGGQAEVLYRPQDLSDLIHFLQAKDPQINTTIIGVGSNLLIRDKGIKGVVIKLGRGFTNISCDGQIIKVQAGALNSSLTSFCYENSIGGLEFLSGIPGSIGGALAMNAGAYGCEIDKVLLSAVALDKHGNKHLLDHKDFGFSYRSNKLGKGWIFVEATLRGKLESQQNIKNRLVEIANKRQDTQPIGTKTTGSTFANPKGHSAWQLIEKAKARGLRIGGAIVSEKHCNFIINDQQATASDIEELAKEVQRRVKLTSGIDLIWELRRIGNH